VQVFACFFFYFFSFCGYFLGLIVGAVAKELFPELGDLNDSDRMLGITLGFLFGCFFFHGLDSVVEFIEGFQLEKTKKSTHLHHYQCADSEISPLLKKHDVGEEDENHQKDEENQRTSCYYQSGSSSAVEERVVNKEGSIPYNDGLDIVKAGGDLPLKEEELKKHLDCYHPPPAKTSIPVPTLIFPASHFSSSSATASSADNNDTRSLPGTDGGKGEGTVSSFNEDDEDDDNSEDRSILLLAKQAMSSPGQRHHLVDELLHILESLDRLQENSNELLLSSSARNHRPPFLSSTSSSASSSSDGPPHYYSFSPAVSMKTTRARRYSTADIEDLAEKIDEETHKLQYLLDHCRRLIHGSGAGFESVLPRIWITESGIDHLNTQLTKMKSLANKIHELLLSVPADSFIISKQEDGTESSPLTAPTSFPFISPRKSKEMSLRELQHTLNDHIKEKEERKRSKSIENNNPFEGVQESNNANNSKTVRKEVQYHQSTPDRDRSREKDGSPHRNNSSIPPAISSSALTRQQTQSSYASSTMLRYPKLNRSQLKTLYNYLDDLDKELGQLHGTVEGYTYQWGKRSKSSMIPMPPTGSKIPMSFILPVTIDCIVDGFLLGITSSINFHAGMILSFANCIEMGFLGLAVSVRVQKCTGSAWIYRILSLIIPPLIMFGTAILSFVAGYSIKHHAVFYNLFISFGIVALLSLVINELLVEARDIANRMKEESEENKEYWWSGMIFFFGIYMVLLMDMLLPVDLQNP
jgi:zinc transporter ZupT